jgi:hypothetical protein
MMKHGLTMSGVLLHSSYNCIVDILKKTVPVSLGFLPIPVPRPKPMKTLTHVTWVRVFTDTGKDRVKNTHGLPMSNTKRDCVYHTELDSLPVLSA